MDGNKLILYGIRFSPSSVNFDIHMFLIFFVCFRANAENWYLIKNVVLIHLYTRGHLYTFFFQYFICSHSVNIEKQEFLLSLHRRYTNRPLEIRVY